VILHCNVLWMSSPKADLRTEKEEQFNHADLVPQFSPRIPCYKASLNHRLAVIVERHFTFSQWASHLQVAYFGQKNILNWTLEEDGGTPPRYRTRTKIHSRKSHLGCGPIQQDHPERARAVRGTKPWFTGTSGSTGQGSTRFEWVELDQSLQWAAFQRLVKLLQSRGKDVLVVVGPFNEHIMAEENHAAFRKLRDGVVPGSRKATCSTSFRSRCERTLRRCESSIDEGIKCSRNGSATIRHFRNG